MELATRDNLSERLTLLETSQKGAWVKWLGNGSVEILETSSSILIARKGEVYNLSDFVTKDEFERISYHYNNVNQEPSEINFNLNYGSDELSCSVVSKKVDEEIISFWTMKAFEIDYESLFQMIAHDMRSPINSIIALVNLMKLKMGQGELMDEDLPGVIGLIEKSSYQAIDLANDILELANLESDNSISTKLVRVERFIQNYINTHRLLAWKKKIKIDMQSTTNIDIHLDEAKITRVLDNLMSNAIKFSPQGSTIRMVIKDIGDALMIKVSDEGIGMPKEIQAHIFKKFGRAKRKGLDGEKSHGLGMSIVKQIMDLHKGEILIESEEGKGTEVKLLFKKNH